MYIFLSVHTILQICDHLQFLHVDLCNITSIWLDKYHFNNVFFLGEYLGYLTNAKIFTAQKSLHS